jgi:DNA-binding CsgD family transcriptional regulator
MERAMTTGNALDRGRDSFARRAWADAFAELSAADLDSPLEPVDVELLVTTAYLIGRDDIGDDLSARVYHECAQDDPARAARCAIWLGIQLMLRGEQARGGGWLARASQLLDEGLHDCAERGYLLVPVALERMGAGDTTNAQAAFDQVRSIGERFGVPDLVALGRLGVGSALFRLGETAQGVALLDEVMVAVTAGELSPLIAGIVYCAGIEACQEIFDLRRGQEWTAALSHWCSAQPDLVPYRGQCLVHRSEIMQIRGAWRDARDEANRAYELLSRPPGRPEVGVACYQQAELHRLCGEFAEAEQAYHQAGRWGREPQPGLALLRLAQGQLDAAAAASRRAVDDAVDRVHRARLLAAHVEIVLASGDVPAARLAADELRSIAEDFAAPLLRAAAEHAAGAVLLAEGDGRAALDASRRAWVDWQELDAPYEAARARVLMALACGSVGDDESAKMEFDAARWVFAHLGAAPDLARVDTLSRRTAGAAASALTTRETQVLRLVASGKSNRAIADELFLSDKTVARHLSNIFGKLGLSSRSAATAYAYQHGLV